MSRRDLAQLHRLGADLLCQRTTATQTATDAPPIMVLRGTHRPRYALASAPQPAPEPLLTVIRSARPRPLLLRPYVQPNALILHIRH